MTVNVLTLGVNLLMFLAVGALFIFVIVLIIKLGIIPLLKGEFWKEKEK